jgi:hypothetical protein
MGTSATLTAMLRDNLGMVPVSDAHAQAIELELNIIKSTFKVWIQTVGLHNGMVVESTRQLLITLVDEPG